MNTGVQALEDQYFLLRGSLATLTAAGASPDQLAQLRSAIVASRNNYWTAVGRVLHDDDPAVEALVQRMNAEENALTTELQHLDSVGKVLNRIAEAISIGSQLAAKAVAI